MGVIDKTETKRKSVWKVAIKTNVEKEILSAIIQACTIEGLDTIKESFSPSEGKKSKYQAALEKGLTPVGIAIIQDDYSQIQNAKRSHDYSCGSEDEILEGGIVIAAEILFMDADQVIIKDRKVLERTKISKLDPKNNKNLYSYLTYMELGRTCKPQ